MTGHPTIDALLAEAAPVPALARVLDAERQRQGLTVYALAKAAEMSAGRMTAILSSEPSPAGNPNPGIQTVIRVLDALGKSLTWLDRQLKADAAENG